MNEPKTEVKTAMFIVNFAIDTKGCMVTELADVTNEEDVQKYAMKSKRLPFLKDFRNPMVKAFFEDLSDQIRRRCVQHIDGLEIAEDEQPLNGAAG